MEVLVTQLCLTLWDPIDCSPPGFSVCGIPQARILEWVTIPFSRGFSWSRDQTQTSCIAGGILNDLSHQGSPEESKYMIKTRGNFSISKVKYNVLCNCCPQVTHLCWASKQAEQRLTGYSEKKNKNKNIGSRRAWLSLFETQVKFHLQVLSELGYCDVKDSSFRNIHIIITTSLMYLAKPIQYCKV